MDPANKPLNMEPTWWVEFLQAKAEKNIWGYQYLIQSKK